MLRDVFYYGQKPNVHPREKPAKNLEDARAQCTTEHFWIINEFCDYTNFDWDFDFEFLPDELVYTENHNNVWPSQHCKDSGTWLCSKKHSDIIIYREDVEQVKRKNIKTDNWKLIEKVDETKFDFSWHPDPTSPPYIYRWGCRYYPATHSPVLEYHVPGATEYKYVDTLVELLPDWDKWVILQDIDKYSFDWAWRPDPTSPPYIYVWGNQHYPGEVMPTVEYHVHGATERNYINPLWKVKLASKKDNFDIFDDIVDFDYSWVPDPNSPPYIYVWGNQWNKPEDRISIQYKTPDATEYKYMEKRVTRKPCKDNWIILNNSKIAKFDYSWEPNPHDPPYIYVFGNQYYSAEIDPTIEYHVPNATQRKYVNDIVATLAEDRSKFKILHPIDESKFDFSWKPNPKDPPYIYVFGNQWHDAITMPTVEYHVEDATQIKYVTDIVARLKPNKTNWIVPKNIDDSNFDYSWVPNPHDPPYIYEFSTQWQKTGGPQYIVPGATEIKYVKSDNVKRLSSYDNWVIPDKINTKTFDFSWHPDSTADKPYIYQFGTQWQKTGGPQYIVPGATEIKYVSDVVSKRLPDKTNYIVPSNIHSFDYSWHPDETEEPYIYEFATEWNDRGGPVYVVKGATEYKYITDIKAKLKPNKTNFLEKIPVSDFDYSWVPHPQAPPYIYVFGNQWNPGNIEPTLEYHVPVSYTHLTLPTKA